MSIDDKQEIKICLANISKEIWKGAAGIVVTGVLLSISFYYNTTMRIEQLSQDVQRHEILINTKVDKETMAEIKEACNKLDNKINHIIDLIINDKQKN